MIHRISKVCKKAELIISPDRSRECREKLNLKGLGKPSNDCLKYLEKMQAN